MALGLQQLEQRVSNVETVIKEQVLPHIENDEKIHKELRDGQAEILAWVSGAKKTTKFVRKYGAHAVTFTVGLMGAAGIGNPAVLAFISKFFH